jgi:aspartate/methionine/tyrosine aminotransferase
MLSRRTTWPEGQNRLSQTTAKRRSVGAPVLDLTGSNPTEGDLAFPVEALQQALALPGVERYRPDPSGLPSARQAVSRWLCRDPRVRIAPDRILLTASTSEAYAYLFKLLADPGDSILTPAPSYPLFEYLAGLESLSLAPYPLLWDGRWHLDRQAVQSLAAKPGVRAIAAIHPNNPTGSFLAADELDFLSRLCLQHDLALISDEVFLDYALLPDPGRAPSALAQANCLTFALSGLSKVAGLPQLKLGWIAASGPEALVARALSRLELIADSYLSVSAPVQHALPELLAAAPAFQHRLLQRLRDNVAEAQRALAYPSPVTALPVEGGWTLVLRLPAVKSGEDWAIELLERDGVLTQPGYFYDFPTEAYLVVSLLTSPGDFAEGLRRLRGAVDRGFEVA